MIAEEAADLGLAGAHQSAVDDHRHLAVVVAQVAVLRAGAEVDPLAEVGVAEEAVVDLLLWPWMMLPSTSPPMRQSGPRVVPARIFAP